MGGLCPWVVLMTPQETTQQLMDYLREYTCISHKYARQRFGITDLDALAQELMQQGYGIKPCHWGERVIGYRYTNTWRSLFNQERNRYE